MRLPVSALPMLVGMTLTVAPAAAQTSDAALATRLDAAIEKAIADKRIVGTVVLVARDGKIVYHRAAGLADREAGTPMREDAIFRYASMTKPFTSIAFMRLVEQGRVKLTDPVTKYLPDFTPRMADGTTPTITLRQLLTHSAGLSYRFLEPKGSVYDRLNISDGLDQPGLSLDANLKRLVQAPLSYAPGTSFRYSLGIDVIGAVIEKVTGKSLPVTVGQVVTTPLRLRDARFAVTDMSRLVTPYADGKPGPVRMTDGMYVPLYNVGAIFAPSRILDPKSYPSGGGGLAGTASEMLRMLEAVRTGGGAMLKPATVALMTQDQLGPQAQSMGPGWGFGYGWGVLADPAAAGSPQSKGTYAWGGAYGHTWFVDPVQRLTVVEFTNTAFEGINGKYPVEIRDAVYGVTASAK
jgi:CubicO group peptidase (beta-lactamase class C family)